MLKWDVRNFSDDARLKAAARIKVSPDFSLPTLGTWNYSPCRAHANGWIEEFWDEESQTEKKRTVYNRPKPLCRHCGVLFRQHQRVGIAWLYMRKRALLADSMGTGKTVHAGGLISMLHETGEIKDVGRVLVVPRSPAIGQWQNELLRFMPNLNLITAEGSRHNRKLLYAEPWDVLLISPKTLYNDRQIFLDHFDLSALITDDIDALRNPETDTAFVLKKLGRKADRMVVMTGTPLQKRLSEIHSTVEAIGGLETFGDIKTFEKRYVTKETIPERDPRTGLIVKYKTVPAYRYMSDFKRRLEPMVLRRKVEDLKDVHLPEINPNDVFLELYPAQRNKYEELRKGVIKIIKEEGAQIKHVTALSKIHYGAQICGGLAALGEKDGPGTSVKLDWVINALETDLEDEKVVLFINYKNNVRAMQDRLRAKGIGFETVWGEEPNRDARMRSQNRFWDDPKCRVLIGTQAIEQSLNLQVARHLINVDMILNPARMAQLAGRIRRDGSAFKHVFVHNLLTVGTQEERYLPLLEREAALADHVWNENNELFAALDPIQLLRLISG